jgi:hypothetical protein
MTEPSSDVFARIECAQQVVTDLCEGRRSWVMGIPARPDYDPDLVIGRALDDAQKALRAAGARAAHAEAEAARLVLAETYCQAKMAKEQYERVNFHDFDPDVYQGYCIAGMRAWDAYEAAARPATPDSAALDPVDAEGARGE